MRSRVHNIVTRLLLCGAAGAVALAPTGYVYAEAIPTIFDAASATSVLTAPRPGILRERSIALDETALNAAFGAAAVGLSALTSVRLPLFPDAIVTATRTSLEWTSSTSFRWVGTLEGQGFKSSVTLNVDKGELFGDVHSGMRAYSIRTFAGRLKISEITARFDREEPAGVVHLDFPILQPINGHFGDCETIDVLVGYTASARAASVNIAQDVQGAIDSTNAAYVASGALQRLRLVAAVEVPDPVGGETGDPHKDLASLSDAADGQWDDLNVLRESYSADAVVILVNSLTACGIAPGNAADDPNPPNVNGIWDRSAYAVVQSPGCSIGNFSFAHETGHVFGLDHDVANASTPISYAHGHVDTPNGFRTIMAYPSSGCNTMVGGANCEVRIQNFSTPLVSNGTNPTGTAADANNVRRLDETVCTTSAFRSTPFRGFDFSKLALVHLRPIVWGPECPACNLVAKRPAWVINSGAFLTASGMRAIESSSMLSAASRNVILAGATQRWLTAGESGTRLPGAGVYYAALRQDGTDITARVDATAQAYTAQTVAAAAGSRPAARSKFGAALSASKGKAWVLGGVNTQGASIADVWSYGMATRRWTKLFLVGLAPDNVHGATYNASDDSVYVIDETTLFGVRGMRVLRIPAGGGLVELLGTWPAVTTGTRYGIATDASGVVYIVSSLASKDMFVVRMQRQLGVFVPTGYAYAKGTLAGSSVSVVNGELVAPVTTLTGDAEVASYPLTSLLPPLSNLLSLIF